MEDPRKEGLYRLRIPILSVKSVPRERRRMVLFKPRSRWAAFAHRSGIEIDGRFGYSRPADFRRSKNGQIIYKTELPYCFSSENGGPFIMAKAPTRVDYGNRN